MEGDLCEDCEHYYEPTDYCKLGLCEGDEKVMVDCGDEEPIEECLYHRWIGWEFGDE